VIAGRQLWPLSFNHAVSAALLTRSLHRAL
jgi:hypothetical protein